MGSSPASPARIRLSFFIKTGRKTRFYSAPRPSSTFTGSETAANLNSANAKTVTVTAKWKSNCNDGLSSVDSYKNFDYTGSAQTFNACAGRTYKLEVWGAQGGKSTWSDGHIGGYGGYSYGSYYSHNNSTLYVFVGETGRTATCATCFAYGGWNGGGGTRDYESSSGIWHPAGGGGATDISLINSAVSVDSYYRYIRSSDSYSSRIIVAGGGGGGNYCSEGGHGGGYIGDDGTKRCGYNPVSGRGGSQSSAGTYYTNYTSGGSQGGFGYGSTCYGQYGNNYSCGGGGGGWYGGGAGPIEGGAGGSSYIGGVSSGRMYQYSTGCTASTVTATYTICTSSTGHAVPNAANTGNGYAKITRQS